MLFVILSCSLVITVTCSQPISDNGVKDIYYCQNCNILLGGLAPIHYGECNSSLKEHAMPRVEAMRFSIVQANKDSSTGIRLGIRIFDTCGDARQGRNIARNFIQMSCSDDSNSTEPYVAGVVGAMYSSVTIDVAKVLELWEIPMVSPASTSSKLLDNIDFPLFARTVPSDDYQTTVIVQILKRLEWKLVATIVSTEYTGKGTNKLFQMASQYGICNAYEETLPALHNRQEGQLVKTICHILLKTDTNVIVLLTDDIDTGQILDAIHTVQSTSPSNGICIIYCIIRYISFHIKFYQIYLNNKFIGSYFFRKNGLH